jgi:hypothetical protein
MTGRDAPSTATLDLVRELVRLGKGVITAVERWLRKQEGERESRSS